MMIAMELMPSIKSSEKIYSKGISYNRNKETSYGFLKSVDRLFSVIN